MPAGNKKIYFASDFHLGVPDHSSSRNREDRIVRWLDEIKKDASEVFLLGDIFDFWFEYSTVIPKGFIRLQGKLAELTDSGIRVYMFKGNHDMWMFDYFKKELGIEIISDELVIERNSKKFYLHHGDGLGPGDPGYKFLKSFFRSKFCQWMFARLHPNFGLGLAQYWSGKSRIANNVKEQVNDNEQEWLLNYSEELIKKEHFDYLIFGHRHVPLDITLSNSSRYVNLGEWINYNSYAVFDGINLDLNFFESASVPDKMTLN
ncbi:UDP-2,3-diacylglucosamine diphosphatase [Daejeonella oryzae]|uniref:UDP-2,3-diacylglucosamine diphosphatase n=1 Tax=Daejeonella oryzae TaxID=1122943 RepID=UPI0003FE1078|nr:UDP-2,3-diacylglucosamine diphosphatase [Daejeonella oryzae]